MSKLRMNHKALDAWWNSPLGQAFLFEQSRIVQPIFSKIFGYYQLLMGDPPVIQRINPNPKINPIWVHPLSKTQVLPHFDAITARQDKLPIASESMDVVYLAHCLGLSKNPHEVLREAFRVLKPEGNLIIAAFNPWSAWGLWCFLRRFLKPAVWDSHFIALSRLEDWLSLLGFDLVQSHRFFFRPPITEPGFLASLGFLEKIGPYLYPLWGGGMIIWAKKSVLTLTPIKPSFAAVAAEELSNPWG